jgi:trimethylamine:corrinoid methyltransferase-like protein
LVDFWNYDRWVEQGSQDTTQRASRLVERILEEHQVEPLPAEIRRDVHAVVEQELQRIGG